MYLDNVYSDVKSNRLESLGVENLGEDLSIIILESVMVFAHGVRSTSFSRNEARLIPRHARFRLKAVLQTWYYKLTASWCLISG